VGAGTALRKETGSSRSTAEQETLDKILAPARQSLADAASSLAVEGQAMALEQAVEYARRRHTN
jgi:hypothetical protein